MGRAFSGEAPWRRVRRVNVGPAPAAGADWSITVPEGRVWRVLSVVAQLVTSAAVANRLPILTMSDGSTVFSRAMPYQTQPASQTVNYSWFIGAIGNGATAEQSIALPDMLLPSGYVLAVSTTAKDAADQWGKPVLFIVETMIRSGDVSVEELPEMVVELVDYDADRV